MDDSTVPKVDFLNKAETPPIFGKWGCNCLLFKQQIVC